MFYFRYYAFAIITSTTCFGCYQEEHLLNQTELVDSYAADSEACDPNQYPFDPTTQTVLCGPFNNPAVFFAPHPDDETLGMAGAIAEHVQAGRDVFIELMTHGEASGVRTKLQNGGTDSWHNGFHEYTLNKAEFGDARVREFLYAIQSLGVKGVFISDFEDGNLSIEEVGERITFWLNAPRSGKLSLKGTIAEPVSKSTTSPNKDHSAVWEALKASGHSDIRGYAVYHYRTGLASYTFARDITPWCDLKRAASMEYKRWEPENGLYAIGYHSVRDIFDPANSDCHEYVLKP